MWFCFSIAHGFQISEICLRQQNLLYEVIGYLCDFQEDGVYEYQGPKVNRITFDRFTSQSVLIEKTENAVKHILFKDGTFDLCTQVISLHGFNPNLQIMVGDKKCVSFYIVNCPNREDIEL